MIPVSELAAPPHDGLGQQFDRLTEYQDGWMDNEGKAVDSHLQLWLREKLVELFPAALPLPIIQPTLEGGVLLEWAEQPWRVSAEFFAGSRHCELLATNALANIFDTFDCTLEADEDWERLFHFVAKYVPRN